MEMNFKSRKVLVTGGTRGIGADIASLFAQNNADVYISATSAKSFEEFKNSYPLAKVKFMVADFSDLSQMSAFLKEVEQIGFDVLINNAGVNKIDDLSDIKLEDWQNIQDVNVRAPFLLSQAVFAHMKKNNWGRIVNIASVFGVVTKEKRLAYTASKSAIIGMTKTMALELASSNILVNAVSPGFIDTELTRRVLGEEGIREMVSKVPVKRLGQPEDISSLVLFLSSDRNGFITGQNIIADGGFTCA